MFCKYCGTQIDNEAKFCISCGSSVSNSKAETVKAADGQALYSQSNAQDFNVNNTGLNILSFLIPLVGLILYAVFYSKEPVKANGVGKWALIGFIIGIVGYAIISGCAASMY